MEEEIPQKKKPRGGALLKWVPPFRLDLMALPSPQIQPLPEEISKLEKEKTDSDSEVIPWDNIVWDPNECRKRLGRELKPEPMENFDDLELARVRVETCLGRFVDLVAKMELPMPMPNPVAGPDAPRKRSVKKCRKELQELLLKHK